MTMVARMLPALILVSALTACGGKDDASEPDCPTGTGPQPTVTTTVDPRCAVHASETTDEADDHSDGEEWKGSVTGTFQFPNCTAGTVSGGVTIAVRADAPLSGRIDTTVSPTNCGGVAIGEQRVSISVTGGTKSQRGFHVQFSDDSVADLAIDGTRATGMLVQAGPNAEFVYLGNANGHTDITLDCTNCGRVGGG